MIMFYCHILLEDVLQFVKRASYSRLKKVSMMKADRFGYVAAFLGPALWGVLPIFYVLLEGFGAVEIVVQRSLWAFLLSPFLTLLWDCRLWLLALLSICYYRAMAYLALPICSIRQRL